MKSGKSLRRVCAVLVIVSVAIAAALVGGASTGRAATSFSFDFKPLIGTPAFNVIPQVTYGGAIGYSIHIENNDNANATHVFIRAKNSNGATFRDASNPNCAANPSDAQQMICSVPRDTIRAGETFDTNFRFTAPSTGTQVSMTVEVVTKAQSVGGSGNNGTTLASSSPVLTNTVAGGGNKEDTYLRMNETAKTGDLSTDHKQKFTLTTPATLLGDPFGTPVSIHDTTGIKAPNCGSCLNAFTTLTLPDASFVNTPGNPFYNGTLNTFNPYSWTVDAKYPNGFQFHGIFHFEDNSNVKHQIPSCASLLPTMAPTVAEPLCWDTLDQINNQKLLAATGRGLENGNITFG